ncbi:hypothetical protein DYB32_003753 [Aphanomyces invadans]|uniref:Uncharacterized protein n=1 Tax=Aphanomyces invadans TaxID=157072 RepID=A0A418AZJ3_9STRA|nr:hypothetical protein DYB32_003753 [Aphanomyces invadans]
MHALTWDAEDMAHAFVDLNGIPTALQCLKMHKDDQQAAWYAMALLNALTTDPYHVQLIGSVFAQRGVHIIARAIAKHVEVEEIALEGFHLLESIATVSDFFPVINQNHVLELAYLALSLYKVGAAVQAHLRATPAYFNVYRGVFFTSGLFYVDMGLLGFSLYTAWRAGGKLHRYIRRRMLEDRQSAIRKHSFSPWEKSDASLVDDITEANYVNPSAPSILQELQRGVVHLAVEEQHLDLLASTLLKRLQQLDLLLRSTFSRSSKAPLTTPVSLENTRRTFSLSYAQRRGQSSGTSEDKENIDEPSALEQEHA